MANRALIKFSSHLKEIRMHLCQQSVESQGLREFINKYYVTLKKQNPELPILIRECSGIEPKIWARFEFGKEKSASVSGLGAEQILNAFSKLTTK
ncbi:NADH dehydrogenase [ubiquinone] 1 alpha subcomplex subunit 2-like protein [Dinothrombium tinctorium]|uniref:NADH dehydrogenase [ubiquinone] 1 alpha subcomplex subunit 2 n=1 Tax=Dinothrombium tinctorium TaxID=1965070 RepID=A0A443RIR2_9ACAR|nr:NADH dehydrogenase [ubiquinone] 1 alpha subcomplex subunit 2-like protein [Dinothrombium tinctorium]